jgi:hypothetical protein
LEYNWDTMKVSRSAVKRVTTMAAEKDARWAAYSALQWVATTEIL